MNYLNCLIIQNPNKTVRDFNKRPNIMSNINIKEINNKMKNSTDERKIRHISYLKRF